jgi:hypothetical protein
LFSADRSLHVIIYRPTEKTTLYRIEFLIDVVLSLRLTAPPRPIGLKGFGEKFRFPGARVRLVRLSGWHKCRHCKP